MTVAVCCLDGVDWRLADDVGLFDRTPLRGQELRNDLDGQHPLFTPRVWTSLMAGEDQRQVTGWVDGDTWQSLTADLTLFWDRFPDTVVQDLHAHTGGVTRQSAMPAAFTEATSTLDALKTTAERRAEYWSQDLADDPQALVAWFGFADRAGHLLGDQGRDLRPAYVWMRDELMPMLDWPDTAVVVSDHGFRLPDQDGALGGSWKGRHAHADSGVLATTDDLADLRTYDRLSTFIPNWQDDIAAVLRTQRLADLGYVDQDGSA